MILEFVKREYGLEGEKRGGFRENCGEPDKNCARPEKIFAAAGSFAMRPGVERGLRLFAYEPERGTFSLCGHYLKEINVGYQRYDEDTDTLYLTHEWGDEPVCKGMGPGGRVLALKVDRETGKVTTVNEKNTLVPQPSFLCLDRTGRYLLVPHHCSDALVTKIYQKRDGTFASAAEGDDGVIDVFRIEADGSLGELCDAEGRLTAKGEAAECSLAGNLQFLSFR